MAITTRSAPRADPAAALGLLYVSRWSNAERASEFAAIYAKALGKRYAHVHDVANGGKEPGGAPPVQIEELETLSGKHTWLTEDGPVVIHTEGDTVMVAESLDQPATEELEQEVFAVAATAAK